MNNMSNSRSVIMVLILLSSLSTFTTPTSFHPTQKTFAAFVPIRQLLQTQLGCNIENQQQQNEDHLNKVNRTSSSVGVLVCNNDDNSPVFTLDDKNTLSSTLNNKQHEENNNNKEKSHKEEKQQQSTLHTYTHHQTNTTLYGLDVSYSKFHSWISYTLSSSSHNFSTINYNITTTKIDKNDIQIKQKLQKVWIEEQLICDNTDLLAVYPSDLQQQQQQQNDDKNGKKKQSTRKIEEEEKKKNKRGGFTDLLATYSNRLSSIIQDEYQDELLNYDNNIDDYNNHDIEASWKSRHNDDTQVTIHDNHKRNNNNNNNSFSKQGKQGLVEWLAKEYGTNNTNMLQTQTFSTLTEHQQLEILQHFLNWFRSNFPYYYDKCGTCGASAKEDSEKNNDKDTYKEEDKEEKKQVHLSCNNNILDDKGDDNKDKTNDDDDDDDDDDDNRGTFMGYVYPNTQERQGKASRTELYQCHKCNAYTRFPRYNGASFVIQHKRGRCGEYSMLLFRLLRVLGHHVRWVIDWADHVWVEVLLLVDQGVVEHDDNDPNGEKKRSERKIGRKWVHLDPCEAAVDNPLLYESWGKKQTYIIAFYAPPRKGFLEKRLFRPASTTTSKVVMDTDADNDKEKRDATRKLTFVSSNETPLLLTLHEDPSSSSPSSSLSPILKQKEENKNTEYSCLPLIEDVTLKYTSDSIMEVNKRRAECDKVIKSTMSQVQSELGRTLLLLQPQNVKE